MRLATRLVIVALAAALLSGCGSSSDEGTETAARTSSAADSSSTPVGASAKSCRARSADTRGLRATGVSCKEARRLLADWNASKSCAAPADASRSSCSLGSYRCLAAATDRGLTVSCARSGQSVAFTVRRG